MSDLTKITAIILKNLSDALLTAASEISKLDESVNIAQTFTQTENDQPILEPEKPKLITRYQYAPKQKILVMFEGAQTPTRCNVLKYLGSGHYVVYPARSPKSAAREIIASQILGLDPDR